MRLSKLTLLGGLALVATACSDDDGITESGTPPPAALIRFINAGADTGTVDFRFIDKVENLPTMQGVAIRTGSGTYQRVDPGTRPVRVFLNSSNVEATKTILVDTTITLAANSRYTLVYAGSARGNADRLAVLEEPQQLPTPAEGQIAVRVLHAAVGIGNVDVFMGPSNSNADGPTNGDPVVDQTGKISNVAYLTLSPFASLPVRTGTTNPVYTFGVAEAGSTTPTILASPNVQGAASTIPTAGPLPGVKIAGSVLTAVVFPASPAGSPAGGTAGRTPTVVLLIDKALDP